MRFTREKQTGEHYRCKDCGKYFWTREELSVHYSGEHELTEDTLKEKTPQIPEAREKWL